MIRDRSERQPALRPTPLRAGPTAARGIGTVPVRRDVAAFAAPSRVQRVQMIAERGRQPGLKGFCPVELRENRRLRDASPQFHAKYLGHSYFFSSAAALEQFRHAPTRYLPVAAGDDVVRTAETGRATPGRLDFACWYNDRLYMFADAQSLETFSEAPALYPATTP